MRATPERAGRFAFWVAMIIMLGYFMIPAVAVVADQRGILRVASAIGGLVLLGLLQTSHAVQVLTRHTDNEWTPSPPFSPSWTLPAQALLSYAPIAWFGESWLGIPAFLAASVLLVLRMPLALLLAAGIVLVEIPVALANGFTLPRSLYAALTILLTGAALYGVVRLASVVGELYRTRADLARLAVAEERLRFARDLHDLLGYRLSVLALMSELASRHLPGSPDKAQEQLRGMSGIVREALTDVRRMAHDYHGMSFEEELDSLTSVLEAAGITCRVHVSTLDLSRSAKAALTWALREGTTNILRHSKASTCTFQTTWGSDWVRLEMENDGVLDEPADRESDGAGSGLAGLSERVGMIGGRALTERDTDRRFRLVVEVPRYAAPP